MKLKDGWILILAVVLCAVALALPWPKLPQTRAATADSELQLPGNVRIVPVGDRFTFIETNNDVGVQFFASLHYAATGRYETREQAVSAAKDYVAACLRSKTRADLKAETAIAAEKAEAEKPYDYAKGLTDGKESGLTLAYCFMQSQPHFTNYYDFEAQAMQYERQAAALAKQAVGQKEAK